MMFYEKLRRKVVFEEQRMEIDWEGTWENPWSNYNVLTLIEAWVILITILKLSEYTIDLFISFYVNITSKEKKQIQNLNKKRE